jgi:hypothetical protein
VRDSENGRRVMLHAVRKEVQRKMKICLFNTKYRYRYKYRSCSAGHFAGWFFDTVHSTQIQPSSRAVPVGKLCACTGPPDPRGLLYAREIHLVPSWLLGVSILQNVCTSIFFHSSPVLASPSLWSSKPDSGTQLLGVCRKVPNSWFLQIWTCGR